MPAFLVFTKESLPPPQRLRTRRSAMPKGSDPGAALSSSGFLPGLGKNDKPDTAARSNNACPVQSVFS